MGPTLPPLEDATAMAVYGDQLLARGDPRGELVQLQLAREEAPFDRRLARLEAEHLARHARELLGGLRTATSLFELRWQRGFIVEASLRSFAGGQGEWRSGRWVADEPPRKPKLPRLTRELLALESAQALQRFTVTLRRSEFASSQLLACAEELAAAPATLTEVGLHLLVPSQNWDEEEWVPAPAVEARVGALRVSATESLAAQLFARVAR